MNSRCFLRFAVVLASVLGSSSFSLAQEPVVVRLPSQEQAQETELVQEEEEASATPWLLEFDFPPLTPGEELSLSDALSLAEARNPSLELISMELVKADARIKQAYGLLLPMLNANVQWTHKDKEDVADMGAGFKPLLEMLGIPTDNMDSKPTVISAQDTVNGALVLNVPIFNAVTWTQIEMAEVSKELLFSSMEQATQSLLFGVATAYYAALMSKTVIAMYEEQIRAAAWQLEIAQRRVDAQAGLRIEVVRAQTAFEQAVQDLANAHLAFDNARDALAVLCDVEGLPMPVASTPLLVPELDEQSLLSTATSQRLDYEQLELQKEIAELQLDQVWMGFLPSLSGVWQASYQFTEPSGFGASDRFRWLFVVTLSIPLYNQMRYGQLDEMRANIEKSEVELRTTSLNVGKEVRQLRRDYLTAVAAIDSAQRQSLLADEGLELAMSAYEAGAGSSLEVSDALKLDASAAINVAASRLRAQMTLLQLYRALGDDMRSLGD
ncbi:MAG: TolC family protein [Myxococcota bacterium]|jgi:outer membrane protein TolC|nr:TolC family protein [Myxococcota bacterium]